MLTDEILKLARDAGFKVDWQHADVAEIKAQRYISFASAIEAAVLAKLGAQSEPVAKLALSTQGGIQVTADYGVMRYGEEFDVYRHPAPVQQEKQK